MGYAVLNMLLFMFNNYIASLPQILDARLDRGVLDCPVIFSRFQEIGRIVLEHVQVAADPLEVPLGPDREFEGGLCRQGRQVAAEPMLDGLLSIGEHLRMDEDLDVAYGRN